MRHSSPFHCIWQMLVFALIVSPELFARERKPAPEKLPAPTVWFDGISGALQLRPEQIRRLCLDSFKAVRSRHLADDTLVALPFEGGNRGIFLTGFDGNSQAAVCFGLGGSLGDALSQAVSLAAEKGLPEDNLLWLKIDVVQTALPAGGFVTRDTPVPLPSLIGIAFGPVSGFAFLPEQLVAGDMTDSQHRLTVHYISEQLARQKRWQDVGRWTAIVSHKGGQRVCFFETLSFLTDGAAVLPLFRGHRMFSTITLKDMENAAREGGDFLVAACSEERPLRVKLPEWRAGLDDEISPREFAAGAIALLRLSGWLQDGRYRQCAARYLDHVLSRSRATAPGGSVRCVVERVPEHEAMAKGLIGEVAYLETNALAVLALLEFLKCAPDDAAADAFRPAVAPLARYLLQQIQPGGEMVRARQYPDGRLVPEIDVTAAALAGAAFTGLYEFTGESTFLDRATLVMENLKKHHLDETPMEALPREPWLMAAIDRYFTFNHDRSWLEAVERMALAAAADQVRNTELAESDPRRRTPLLQGSLLPDLFGSVPDYPSLTASAERTRLLAIAARLLRDARGAETGLAMLTEATPAVLFQMQAQMLPEVRMYLEKPEAYRGLFRDHLRDFGFGLGTQARQLLSLAELAMEMQAQGIDELPIDAQVGIAMKATRRRISEFPRTLTEALLPAGTVPLAPNFQPRLPESGNNGLQPAVPVRPVPKR